MLTLRVPRRCTFLALIASLAMFAGMLVASPSHAAAGPPTNVGKPQLCGLWECPEGIGVPATAVATVGEKLRAEFGEWKPVVRDADHLTFQWLRDGVPFTPVGTWPFQHIVQPADAGHAFSVRVTYTPPGHTSATVTTGTKYVGLVATTTSLSLGRTRAPYGKAHKVKAAIRVTTADGSVPHGRVHLYQRVSTEEGDGLRFVREDRRPTSYRVDAAGTRTVRLPRLTHVVEDGRLVALFVPDNKLAVRASRSPVRRFRTTSITPKVTARVSKTTIKAGKRFTVRVRVTLPKGTPSGDRVVVRLGSTVVGKSTARHRTGTFTDTVRTRAINKRGARLLRAVYKPNGDRPLRTGRSAPVRVRIR